MCLYTKQKQPLIAEKPIKAFKVLIRDRKDKLWSPYQEYDYTEYVNSHCIIADVIPKANYPIGDPIAFCLGDIRVVNKGLHLFISKDRAVEYTIGLDGVLFECRIPTGSYYFIDSNETYICTNQFWFIKEIDINEMCEDLIKQLKK